MYTTKKKGRAGRSERDESGRGSSLWETSVCVRCGCVDGRGRERNGKRAEDKARVKAKDKWDPDAGELVGTHSTAGGRWVVGRQVQTQAQVEGAGRNRGQRA